MTSPSNDDDGPSDGDNPVLRASLLRGALSVRVGEVDIRRGNASTSNAANGGGVRDTIDVGEGVAADRGSVRSTQSTSSEWSTTSSVASVAKSTRKNIASAADTTLVSALYPLYPSGLTLSPIETDYILQVESAANDKVEFGSDPELETYCVSKQYVDIRHLANKLKDHAESIVEYYEDEEDVRAGKSPSGKKHKKRWVTKAVRAATNTDSRTSHLADKLDEVYSKKGGDGGHGGRDGKKMERRNSANRLKDGAPAFVREVLVGIDKFYEAIYSEKRQFGKRKTHYNHVKDVADRRREIIDRAFGALTDSLTRADLGRVKQYDGRVDLYSSMEVLLEKIEKFLLTDVVVEHGQEGEGESVASQMQRALPLKLSAIRGSSSPLDNLDESERKDSKVRFVTTRRRASLIEREAEDRKCREVGCQELDLEERDEEGADDAAVGVADGSPTAKESGFKSSVASLKKHFTKKKKKGGASDRTHKGLLPDHPIDFAIAVVAGAAVFKLLEGREMMVPMDVLAMFVITCGLLGYHLAGGGASDVAGGCGADDMADSIVSYAPVSASPKSKERKAGEGAAPGRRMAPRPSLAAAGRSAGSLQLTDSQAHTMSLLQRSLSVRNSFNDDEDDGDAVEKERKPIVPAKTFPKFPDGAKLGSHLNCWSSPPSGNFMVRGPNYLKDKKKVPSSDYLFPCRGCDLFLTDLAPTNLGRNRAILEGRLREKPTFIVNYRLPWGVFLSYHEIPERFLPFLRRGHGHGDQSVPLPSTAGMTAGDRAACNFLLSDSEEKDATWKIVPVVAQGPWMVKKVVGGKPAIVGKQLPITYVYQPAQKLGNDEELCEYLEADLDIVSSAAARNILAVVRSYTNVLTVDLGFVVQGNRAEELPEQMMLGLRLHGLDPLTAGLLPKMDDDVGDGGGPGPEDDDGNETE